jgi:hypothetical protein
VVTYQDRLRSDFVLVRLQLRPNSKPPRGNWKEVCSRSLELLERCVYLDKDLVLPPVAISGPEQSYFVVASTDLERAEIMMTRIRGQLGNLPELNAAGTFEVSASAIRVREASTSGSLQKQLEELSATVAEMVRAALGFVNSRESETAGA